jgi:hypothetical protein
MTLGVFLRPVSAQAPEKGAAAATGAPAAASPQEPAPAKPRDPIYFFGQDLKQILESEPQILLTGDAAKRYLESTRAGTSGSVVPLECRIRGQVRGDLAELSLQLTATSDSDEPQPLALGLAGAILLRATAADGPARLTWDTRGYTVWFERRGQSSVAIDLIMALAGTAEQPLLALAIAECPVTSLEVQFPRGTTGARLSPATPLEVEARPDGTSLLRAALGPRRQLELRWRGQPQAEPAAPPLLLASSESSVTIETGTIETRTALRLDILGNAKPQCEIRLPADEQVLDVVAGEGKLESWTTVAAPEGRLLKLAFTAPVPRLVDLMLHTQRPWSGEALTWRGPAIPGAARHLSWVVLRAGSEWDVAPTAAKNLRPVEPSQLPPSLRSASAGLAWRGHAAGSQLVLSVRPRGVAASVRTTAAVLLAEGRALVSTRWQFTAQSGRLSEVAIALPAAYSEADFVRAAPVQSVRLEGEDANRTARVFLSPPANSFELRLQAAIPATIDRGLAKIDLPRPRIGRAEATWLGLGAARGELVQPTAALEAVDQPLDEATTAGLHVANPTLRVFRAEGLALDQLTLRVAKPEPVIQTRTSGQVLFARDAVRIEQTIEYRVRGGVLAVARLRVPEAIASRMEFGPALPAEPDSAAGEWRVRLPSGGEPVRVSLRYDVPLEAAADGSDTRRLAIPLVQPADGVSLGAEFTVHAPAEMAVALRGSGWRPESPRANTGNAAEPHARFTAVAADTAQELALELAHQGLAPVASVVIDRTLVDSALASDGSVLTRVRFLVSAVSAEPLALQVPPRARLTGLRVGGREVAYRESPGQAGRIVFRLPDEPLPVVIEATCSAVESRAPGPWGERTWTAPDLERDSASSGAVLWMVELAQSAALLGGSDAYRPQLRWAANWSGVQPVPGYDSDELERWITEATGAARPAAAPAPGAAAPSRVPALRLGRRYLFSRSGRLEPLVLRWVDRGVVLLVASGTVLLFGLVLVVTRSVLRWALLGAVAISLAAWWVMDPATLFELLRSALLGVALTILAAGLHAWLRHRRRREAFVYPDPALVLGPTAGGGSPARDSTARQLLVIRPRGSSAELPPVPAQPVVSE